MIIYTTCRNIQRLDYRVLEGIVKNKCSLICVNVNKGKHKRERFTHNWNEAFKHCDEDVFIGMDSDIILEKGVVDGLLEKTKEYDFVWMPSNEHKLRHAVWIVKKEVIDNVPLVFEDKKHCPMCRWTQGKIPEAGYKINCINKSLKEANYGEKI